MAGVSSEYGKLRKVLLCKPDYFEWLPVNETALKYLRLGQSFTVEDAQKQHQEFSDAFRSAEVEILYVEPRKGLTYQVYTRDIGKNTRKGVLLGGFRWPVRQDETSLYEKFFTNQGIPIFGKVSKGIFEGGDIHYIDNETMVCGSGARSEKEGMEEAGKLLKEGLGLNLIAVELPADLCHLDLAFTRVAERACLACVDILPDSFLKMLKDRKIEIIEVPKKEAIDLKCNVVTIDDKTVMSFKENTDVNHKLEALGFEVFKPHMSIFTRGGGGPRCSCFPLERDEEM